MAEKPHDKTEIFHDALIQHGNLSSRVYLMKINRADPLHLIKAMDKLAMQNEYSKIFAKVPEHQAEIFLGQGYEQEASVPGFFHGQETAVFLARYINPERRNQADAEEIEKTMELALSKKNSTPRPLPPGTTMRQCTTQDAQAMSGIYKKVFRSYPFPIDKPGYIMETMQDNVVYFGVEKENGLISLSSSEMDTVSKNVEMTDFATLPEFSGNGFAYHLLGQMETAMRSRSIQTAYTIARSVSAGINITFARAGYSYGGRLINNTNISGQIESMNVWYKAL